MDVFKVFVYGTLKKGQPNHYLMEDPTNGVARWIGDGRLCHKYPLIVETKSCVPLLLAAKGTGKVVF